MSYFRHVKIIYSNNETRTITMSAHLHDDEIFDYFEIGKLFNIGHINDNVQSVEKVEILKSPQAINVLQLMDKDYSYQEALKDVTEGWVERNIVLLEGELNKFI